MKSSVDKRQQADRKPLLREGRTTSSMPTPASVAASIWLTRNGGTSKTQASHSKEKARRIPRPKLAEPPPQPSFIARAFGWLGLGNATPKQLQVVETVQLGEKRFVTILQAEGRRFLIGGGPQGVSLLTALEDQLKPSGTLKTFAAIAEPTE
jgi:hypothetical protein